MRGAPQHPTGRAGPLAPICERDERPSLRSDCSLIALPQGRTDQPLWEGVGAERWPPRALRRRARTAVLHALEEATAVGRVRRRSGRATGITRAPGPGSERPCHGARLRPRACLCGFGAPGLPSRTPDALGMPFGLTTPGGQPVGFTLVPDRHAGSRWADYVAGGMRPWHLCELDKRTVGSRGRNLRDPTHFRACHFPPGNRAS